MECYMLEVKFEWNFYLVFRIERASFVEIPTFLNSRGESSRSISGGFFFFFFFCGWKKKRRKRELFGRRPTMKSEAL